ncbi:unnamed protein product [Tetraodon nigroviridis]|uniref:(spotted green pufferfish) hypothetical protein n=1 Tax=Tetraodon nigroviridis TaxID=99883 RepID=Q4RQT2_TETNG|nr:unnamed protein product [Tetraodon nigroviridis]
MGERDVPSVEMESFSPQVLTEGKTEMGLGMSLQTKQEWWPDKTSGTM